MKRFINPLSNSVMAKPKTLFVAALLFISSGAYAQSRMIQLQQKKATMKSLITAIEKQTSKSVDYGQNIINLKKVINVSSSSIELSDLLKEMLRGRDWNLPLPTNISSSRSSL